MTDRELKALKDNLWHAANMLRASAHIAANKYGQPILGLVFLRYADILFKQHKTEMAENLNKECFVRFRFPGHETTEFENGIPNGWEKTELSELLVEHFNGG
ncbi:MAG: type I restriction-modification system subunit M N-terminal domain-containing protein [Succiniclasticum sp.]|nr:type I restriction-modification system subunit M N-terminal domain-containing protein [Succiniclasticum sp.]